MSVLRILAPLFLILFSFCSAEKPATEMKVMTFNVRFDNPSDGLNAWPHRIPIVEAYMKEEMPDIVGMQENLHHQNQDLLEIMPGYAFVGTGRDDGLEGGEFSPIFYRTDRFEKLQHGQFWLSETPDEPGSIGWAAVLPRIVTWIELNDKNTSRSFYLFNTHFSHVSDLARRKSMEFMSEQITQIAGDSPVIAMGDFNIIKGTDLYHHKIEHLKNNNSLINAEYISQTPVINAESTFNAFRDQIQPRVIDYIFVDGHFEVFSFGVDLVKEGDVFISDHWPVKAVVGFVEE